jgi:hypothetical protein
MPDAMVLIAAASMVAGFYELWAKGPYLPKARKKTPLEELNEVRHALIVRIASAAQSIEPPLSVRIPEDERLVLLIPVILNECVSTKRLRPLARAARRELVWPHSTHSGKKLIISPVDAGTLLLTRRRFIFTSARRRREFPLAELTHFSTCRTGIALATRGRNGVAYFTGLENLRLGVPVAPHPPQVEPARFMESALNGQDLEEILQLLRTTPPPGPT